MAKSVNNSPFKSNMYETYVDIQNKRKEEVRAFIIKANEARKKIEGSRILTNQ